MIRSILAYGRLRAGEVETAVQQLTESTAWFEHIEAAVLPGRTSAYG